MLTTPRNMRFHAVIKVSTTNTSEGEVWVPELVWVGESKMDAEKRAERSSIEHPACSFVVMGPEIAFCAAPLVSRRFFLEWPAPDAAPAEQVPA